MVDEPWSFLLRRARYGKVVDLGHPEVHKPGESFKGRSELEGNRKD